MNNKGTFLANWPVIALVIVAAVLVFNQYQLSSLLGGSTGAATVSEDGVTVGTGDIADVKSEGLKVSADGDVVNDVIKALIPTGVPKVYGPELKISFDEPVQALQIIANLDRQIPTSSLSADEMKRFVNVGTQISCEFCCSAPAVINQQGQDLCGCSHAASFRGLSKFLIKQHPSLTDDQILWELTRWKSLYYPRNMVEKGVAATKAGLELSPQVLNDRSLLTKLSAGDLGSVGELPAMVGGC